MRRAPSSVVTARCPAPGLARSVPIYARACRRARALRPPPPPRPPSLRLPSTGCRTPPYGELPRRAVRARPLSEVATGERARVPPGIETGPPLPGDRPGAGAAGAAPVPRHRAGLRRPHQDPHHRAAPGRHGPGDVPRRAGHPAGPADPRHPGRRRHGGRERARAELRHRRRHRRQDEAHRAAAAGQGAGAAVARAGVRPGAGRAQHRLAVADHEPARRRPGADGDRLLRAGLHAHPQAAHGAEHRVGRRGGLHAGGDRLGGGHRPRRVAGAGDVRRDLLLDAAALLGAGDALPRRLRRGRRADAAGGGHAGAGVAADRRSTRG